MNLDTLDKSFLRLVTDFSVAKFEMMENSQFIEKDSIILSPNEKYTQISNSSVNIAFDDSYKVELVNVCDEVELDITSKVYINEFQDINGIYQIAYEISPILQEFYHKQLFIKFTHLDSDLVLWSNSFLCTDTVKSVRLDYKNYAYYKGISYDKANIYQSIRISCSYNLPSSKETNKIYTQLNGEIKRSRPIQAIEYSYNIEATDTFTFDRLMTALNSDVVYLNGVRFMTSENVQSDDRQGVTNQFATGLKGQFIANDTYTANYQIAPNFQIVSLFPFGSYTISPTTAFCVFNTNVLFVSKLKLFNYDTDELLEEVNTSIFENSFSASFSAVGFGTYYFTFEATSVLGQILNVTDKNVWKFRVALGDFSPLHFDSGDFFTT